MQMQGVTLATDVLGLTVTVSQQASEPGTGGTGTGSETSTPDAGGTAATAMPDATATADTGTETGTGTGTGGFSQGTVEDLIVEPMTGIIQYVVLSFSGSDRWVPVPVSTLNWDSTMSGFALNAGADVLQNAPSFTSDQFPDTSTSGWDQEWSTFWQSNGGMGTGSGSGSGGVSISTATATP
jgi:hypothetical protein